MSNRDESPVRDLFETQVFAMDRFSGIYCSTDCVLDAFDRGYPEHRGILQDEDD